MKNEPNNTQNQVKTYMGLSVFSILFFLPLAVLAIINSIKAGQCLELGDFAGATEASKKAKKWAIWAIVISLLFSVMAISANYVIKDSFAPYTINGDNMEPSIVDGSMVLVSKNFKNIALGDIVLYEDRLIALDCKDGGMCRFPVRIGRVAGVPGDSVEESFYEIILEENEFYIKNDNTLSTIRDSRATGPIMRDNIKGVVVRAF